MLDKQKVKLMTELAFYEQNQGKEDFKINEYYRKDYVSFHTLCSILWITLGYVCVIGLIVFAALDLIVSIVSKSTIIMMGIMVVVGYFVVVILYAIVASRFFNKKHRAARQRMKIYNHNLTRLLKMYEGRKDNG